MDFLLVAVKQKRSAASAALLFESRRTLRRLQHEMAHDDLFVGVAIVLTFVAHVHVSSIPHLFYS